MIESRHTTDKSFSLFKEAEKLIPGGVNGNIKFREPYPLFLSRASGSHVWDVDGNEYVDYVLSYGALILGHGHPAVLKALRNISDSFGTTLFGNPTPQESEFAEILLRIFMKDGMLRFTTSGLEATLLANRLGMAKSGKRKIAKFDGHYHGANPFLLANYRPKKRGKEGALEKEADSAEVRGDILDDVVVLPFNDIDGTKRALEREDVSSVILEPFEDGYIPAKRDFMHFLRKYTEENGIILVFDEVKTGFRIRLGGAVEYYGIKPDMICLGKIIGGGAPIGAVIGKPEIMELLDPRNRNKVFHSGTYNGNPISITLGMATVSELMEGNNFSRISEAATTLRKLISQTLDEFGVEHRTYGEGGVVNYTLSKEEVHTYRDISDENMKERKRIDSEMMKEGIYLIPASRYSMSLAHTEGDIDLTVNAMRRVLSSGTSLKEKPK
jgi:glutamate-1-semialdehyde 2,1-aminomutase